MSPPARNGPSGTTGGDEVLGTEVGVAVTGMPGPYGPAWRLAALCEREHAEHFFSPPHEHRDDRQRRENAARALCRACPVQRECLEHALRIQEPHGIWGGLTEIERRRHLGTGTGEQQTA